MNLKLTGLALLFVAIVLSSIGLFYFGLIKLIKFAWYL